MNTIYVVCANGVDGEPVLVTELGFFTKKQNAESAFKSKRIKNKYNPDSLYVRPVKQEPEL